MGKTARIKPWKEALYSHCACHMTVFRNCFTSIPWWKFAPNQLIFANGHGSWDNFDVAMRSVDVDSIIAYLYSSIDISLNMDKITVPRQVQAACVDPRTGERTRVGKFPAGAVRSFSAPAGWEDALLLIEKS